MSWFWTILLLTLAFRCNSSEALKKSSSDVVVVGTVYCDMTCFQQDIPKSNHFIPGATVAVECKDNSKPSFRQQVQTDIHGEFKVHLPFPVSKHLRKIEGCSVKLISSNKPYCSIAATADSSTINLKSRKQGTHVFSAGFFAFKPAVCDSKPINNKSKLSQFSNPISQLPPIPGLPVPPIPELPVPPIPGLPVLPTPGLPLPPISGLPVPPIPGLPVLPTPGLPLPPIPGLPGLPTPGLPLPPISGLPVPPIPGLPVPPIPGLPGLPTPGLPLPPISGLPVPPIPGLPGLPTPGLPLPPIPGLKPPPPSKRSSP